MSSVRKPAGPAKSDAARKPAEALPPKPVFTPTNVLILFVIIIVASLLTYWKVVYAAKTAEIATIRSDIVQQERQNEIYKKKAAMLTEAVKVNEVMDEKLESEKHYFLGGQQDIVDFFNTWFMDLLYQHFLIPEEIEIEPEVVFKISWKMMPFETLPNLSADVLTKYFNWEYIGEGKGTGEVETALPNFLEPMTIKLDGFMMDYERMKKLIEALQRDKTYMVTVHGFENSGEGDNIYSYRTLSKYTIVFTVYFMNPEGLVSGDVPAGMPGDKSL